MEKPPSFQWYPKDCDTDENVRMMDDAEYGFYGRCLNHAWINDGLPGNLEDIARVIGRPLSRVRKYWERVGKCFVLFEDRFRNMKQEGQRKTAREFQESRRNSANSRWANKEAMHTHSECIEDALRTECSASASASASAKQEEQEQAAQAPPVPHSLALVPQKKGTRFALQPMPEDWATWALNKRGWNRQQAQEVFDDFSDFWVSKSGADATKLNWESTWRRWVRNQRAPPGQGNLNITPDKNQTRRNETLAIAKFLRQTDEPTRTL